MTGAPFFIHDLADLLRMDFAQTPAKHREILGKDIDEASLDGAPTGHDRVAHELLAVEVEVMGAMLDEGVQFAERAFVQQEIDPFPGSQTAFFMLGIDPLLSPTQARPGFVLTQCLNSGLVAHVPRF
jgi:hypothetical protein